MSRYARLALTETVQLVQQEQGSRPSRRGLGEAVGRYPDPLGEREVEFIGQRDGFYLASVGETGWPYVQFRGGPAGFVHVLDEHTLAYADVRGNRQYITNGNVRTDGRVSLFFMDYARRSRLKLFGHASTRELDEDAELDARVCSQRTDGHVERVMVIRIEGYDWNCPKHIPNRYSAHELAKLHEQIRTLERDNNAVERENAALRQRLVALGEVDHGTAET